MQSDGKKEVRHAGPYTGGSEYMSERRNGVKSNTILQVSAVGDVALNGRYQDLVDQGKAAFLASGGRKPHHCESSSCTFP
jgi:hypothetical protein